MAEPFSVAASALTVLSASTTCAQTVQSAIRNWRNAPGEIDQLNNEVADVQALLDALRTTLSKGNQVDMEVLPVTERKLSAVKSALTELEELIKQSFTRVSSKRLKFNWVQKKGQINKLQKNLFKARYELQDAVIVNNFIHIQAIGVRSENPAVTSRRTTVTNSDPLDVKDVAIDNRKNVIHIPTSSPAQIPTSHFQYQGNLTSIRYIRGRRNACENVPCDCICHVPRTYKTPSYVNAFLGTLFMGYSGIPIMAPGCSNDTCKARINRALEIVYCFPQWWMARCVRIVAATTSVGNPVFGLSFARVVAWGTEDNILRLALTGHTDGLKLLLDKKTASLTDVDPNHGRTALHYAVQHNRIDTCKFLLAAGADPYLVDYSNTSSHQKAWEYILTWQGNPKDLEELKRLFPENDILETRELSHLHKVVLNILPLKLTTELQNAQHRLQVNARDSKGQTPLHWAAKIGKHEEAQQLLGANAKVDLQDEDGNTPLIFGASEGSLQTLELLISAGAKVDQENHRGDQALHYASRHQKDPALVKLLVQAGAIVTCRNKHGITPFLGAAIRNRVEIGSYLLEKGADIDQAGKYGDTAIFETIYHDSHDFLCLLLQNKANHLHVNHAGSSIAHAAALEADVETVRILFDAELHGIDWDAKDAKGKAALEIVADRLSPPPEFKEMFQQLVAKHRNTREKVLSQGSW